MVPRYPPLIFNYLWHQLIMRILFVYFFHIIMKLSLVHTGFSFSITTMYVHATNVLVISWVSSLCLRYFTLNQSLLLFCLLLFLTGTVLNWRPCFSRTCIILYCCIPVMFPYGIGEVKWPCYYRTNAVLAGNKNNFLLLFLRVTEIR